MTSKKKFLKIYPDLNIYFYDVTAFGNIKHSSPSQFRYQKNTTKFFYLTAKNILFFNILKTLVNQHQNHSVKLKYQKYY